MLEPILQKIEDKIPPEIDIEDVLPEEEVSSSTMSIVIVVVVLAGLAMAGIGSYSYVRLKRFNRIQDDLSRRSSYHPEPDLDIETIDSDGFSNDL